MTKKADDMPECDFCNQKFTHRKTYKYHKKHCGKKRLSEFDETNDLARLDSMNDALVKNDYDESLNPKESRQTGLNSY